MDKTCFCEIPSESVELGPVARSEGTALSATFEGSRHEVGSTPVRAVVVKSLYHYYEEWRLLPESAMDISFALTQLRRLAVAHN